MKEKYNSEKGLRAAYSNFQFPIEAEAFEKFKVELDKEKRKNRVFWWKKYGLILIPIFLIGAVSTYAIYQSQNATHKSSLSKLENGQPSSIKPIPLSTSDEASKSEVESTAKAQESPINSTPPATESNTQKPNYSPSDLASATNQIAENPANFSSDHEVLSFSSTNITTNLDEGDRIHNPKEGLLSASSQSTISIPPASSDEDIKNLTASELDDQRSLVSMTNIFSSNIPTSISAISDRPDFQKVEIEPYVEPFKKYFYVSLRGGLAINDNFGPYDPYLSTLKSKEYTYGGVLAYKFSPNYAVEFSFAQHDFSVGHLLREEDPFYSRKSGTRVTVLKAALVSKLWSPFDGFNINMTNGIAIMSGDGGLFGKGSSSQNTPGFIQEAILDRLEISSSKQYLYAGGLQLNIQLSRNLECSMNSEYNLGFKPWIDTRLKYIEGEGVIRTAESRSFGSFFGFNFGFKYSLRK